MKIYVAYKKETAVDGIGKREKVLGQASNLNDLLKSLRAKSISAAIYECNTYSLPEEDEEAMYVSSEKLVRVYEHKIT